ncbi:PREDICTED: histone-lysine N-methyltransferase SETMAR-like [Trachymyrmex septentrionalis]|uniref:histone-lysine N-methyltransferase SETMAR-like n=1 Tax=Trachymyrmex septentrionalis TaxID=34720 RepID=UPI00084F6AEF|nr:PREDICTED: histone-lysine N-methyltransferase SETMAR-like [Trachymyrmex septentrionalis]
MNIEDAPRSGRPVTTDVDQITALIGSDRQITVREIAAKLNIGKSVVSKHLNKLQIIKKLDVWVPHDLTEKNRINRISISDLLYKRNEYDPFLKRIITGDEKWIIYNNVERKRSWSKRGEPPSTTPKAGLHPKKVMLCIWWNWKGIVYYELLPNNETIDSDKYCSQLDKLKTRQKLLALGWDVLPHPPYSPDIAPSDYHLFRSLQNSINGLNFASLELLKNYLDSFFAEKSQDFYEREF